MHMKQTKLTFCNIFWRLGRYWFPSKTAGFEKIKLIEGLLQFKFTKTEDNCNWKFFKHTDRLFQPSFHFVSFS